MTGRWRNSLVNCGNSGPRRAGPATGSWPGGPVSRPPCCPRRRAAGHCPRWPWSRGTCAPAAGAKEEWEERWRRAADQRREEDEGAARPAPYLGLASYGVEHASLFFGREALTRDLLKRLAAGRFLAVFGPSGSGKSSLLRAGLLAAVGR